MKKIFYTLLFLALSSVSAFAGENTLKIADFTILAGQEKELAIELNNEDIITSLQFDIALPQGLTYVEGSVAKVADRITRGSHSVKVVPQKKDGKIVDYRFGIFSTGVDDETKAQSSISEHSGAILTIKVKASEDCVDGKITFNEAYGSDASKPGESAKMVDVKSDATLMAVSAGTAAFEKESGYLFAGNKDVLNVTLDNVTKLVNLQAIVTLPKGVSFVKNENGDYINYSNRLTENVTGSSKAVPGKENVYTLLLESLTNDVISGNSGVLFGLNVAADQTFAGGDIVISDIKVSTPKGTGYVVGGELKYKVYADPTGDGVWDVVDVTKVVGAIMNGETNPSVDVSGEGDVDIVDVTLAVKKSMD